MYIRKKHNRSGTISVVVVSKNDRKYKEIKSFGCSSLESEIELLCEKARKWIHSFGGQQEFDFDNNRTRKLEETIRVVENMDAVLINGIQLLLNQVYDSIGFNQILDEILCHLVIASPSFTHISSHFLLYQGICEDAF